MPNLDEEKYTPELRARHYTLGSVYCQNYSTIKWRYFRLLGEQWQLLGSICSCQRCFFLCAVQNLSQEYCHQWIIPRQLTAITWHLQSAHPLPSNTASFYWVIPAPGKYSCKKKKQMPEKKGDHSEAEQRIASILPLPSKIKIEIGLKNHELFKIVLHILVAGGGREETDQKPTVLSTALAVLRN